MSIGYIRAILEHEYPTADVNIWQEEGIVYVILTTKTTSKSFICDPESDAQDILSAARQQSYYVNSYNYEEDSQEERNSGV